MRTVTGNARELIIRTVRSRTMCCLLVSAAVLGLLATNNAVAQTCTPPPPNMVSWWPGDANANDIQGSNNGTLQNGATFAAGMVGQAFRFDGVDDYVHVPAAASLGVANAYTLDAWVLSTGPTNTYRPIFYRGDSQGDDIEVYIQATTNR